jgi:hypothetical protein
MHGAQTQISDAQISAGSIDEYVFTFQITVDDWWVLE